MPIRRLRVGSLLHQLLRACIPLLQARRIRTSFVWGLILFRQTRQWQLVMEELALGSLRHRGVYALLRAWDLGQRRVVRVRWDTVLVRGNMRD